ncbi:MAG: SRPBCC family protein [Pseudohongiellaceae bacterium]
MGKCHNTIVIDAPVNRVWAAIADFHDLSWAPNVITSVEKPGEKSGREVGARRILNNAFHETLLSVDDDQHSLSYSIDDGPGPVAHDAVSDYVGVVKVSEAGQGCVVEWASTYDSDNEESVAEFCNPIYRALLEDLRQSMEKEAGAE